MSPPSPFFQVATTEQNCLTPGGLPSSPPSILAVSSPGDPCQVAVAVSSQRDDSQEKKTMTDDEEEAKISPSGDD